MKTLKELDEIRQKTKKEVENRTVILDTDKVIVVSMGTCGIAAGAREVLLAAQSEVIAKGLLGIKITQSGRLEACSDEPIVEVKLPQEQAVTYVNMTASKMKEVISAHIIGGRKIDAYTK